MNYEIQNTRIGNIAIGADDENITFLLMSELLYLSAYASIKGGTIN